MRYKYSLAQVQAMFQDDPETPPFLFYMYEDKSSYKPLSETINRVTGRPWIDEDGDFLVGERGDILMNMNFSFINTDLLTEAARTYEANFKDPDYKRWVEGLDVPTNEARNKYYYCKHRTGTKQYNDFWGREYTRRTSGMTIPGKLMDDGTIQSLRITNDHYHFLNYSRIKRPLTEEERAYYDSIGLYRKKTIEGFPFMWDGHYWKHKLNELGIRNSHNTCDAKARRKGYSYIRGSGSANTMNTIPDITIAIGSWDSKYLTGNDATLVMVKRNLDWLEQNTHWKRFYLSEDLMSLKLGYRKKKYGNAEFGYKSSLVGASLYNNPKGFVGKGAQEIDIEEAGVCPVLISALDVTTSAVEAGDEPVGMIRLFGTGGEEEADWGGFAQVYYGCLYNTLNLENIFDFNARHTQCGYFHPNILNYHPYMDKDGNSDLPEAWKADRARRAHEKATKGTKQYIMYCGQRANRPEEAFRRTKDNRFASPALYDQIRLVQHNPDIRTWKDGMYSTTDKGIIFQTNDEISYQGRTTYPYIENYPIKTGDDQHGCFRMFNPPVENVKEYSDLYFAVYDPVAKDKETKTVTKKDSLDSFFILGNPYNRYGIQVPFLNLSFCGRFANNEDVHRQLSLACMDYGCKLLPEVDRGNIVTNFRNWKLLNLLHRNPLSYINNKIVQNFATDYGIAVGEGHLAEDGLLYLYDLLYQIVSYRDDGTPIFMLNYIHDLPTLLELKEFDKVKNFDRVSALRLAPFMFMFYKRHYVEAAAGKTNEPRKTLLGSINAY